MNYRHAFHAGCIADVFKHTVLIALLERLRQKESAFFVLETHAGAGLYDLRGASAEKTGEYRHGAAKLFDALPAVVLLEQYRQTLRQFNPDGSLRFYPGSPLIIGGRLRPPDRAVFCELHPEDFQLLRRAAREPNAAFHKRDGYEAIGAFLPPREKRGLVFIDPPFENPDEFAHAAAMIAGKHALFPQGVWALWYPVKDRAAIWRFQEAMLATGIRNQLAIEFLTGDSADARFLSGSGLHLINPPYRLDWEIRPALEELQQLLAPGGKTGVDWLVGE